MDWQQQQLLASQRRIREFQAQQSVVNSQANQYVHSGVQSMYPTPSMYQTTQQSYVYPPSTQWTVVSDNQRPTAPPYHIAAYGQPYYPQYYQQRQAPTSVPTNHYPQHPPPPPWHSTQLPQVSSLPKPSGKGLTYAELLSKALPPNSEPAANLYPQAPAAPAPEQSIPKLSTLPNAANIAVPKPVVNLPKPPPPPVANAPQDSEPYPPSLLKYVERAFLHCKNDGEKGEVQRLLKLRIESAKQNGVLWSQDWDSMALPQLSSSTGAKRKSEPRLSKKQQKRLKKQQAIIAAAAQMMSPSLANAAPSIAQHSQIGAFPVNAAAVKNRNARFGQPSHNVASTASRPLSLFYNRLKTDNTDGDIDLDWESLKICGTCDQLEKKYLRLTSAPDPSTVRPLQVLIRAFEHIKSKWSEERNYLFFWEQMKSLRQDMTIQHIIGPFTISIYETNARVCLEVDDLSEYNQCQTQLCESGSPAESFPFAYCTIRLYDNHSIDDACKCNRDEFMSYRLLYLLLTNDPMSISLMLHGTTSQERRKATLSHAINVLRAFRTCDYCRFFELAYSAPLQCGQIVRHLFPTIRTMLGFSNLDSCRTWLAASGASLDLANDQVICKDCNIIRAQLVDNDSQDIVGVTHGTF